MPNDIKITKRLPATPDEVYDAWTDPKSLMQWMTPGTKSCKATMDVRIGGKFHIDMIDEKQTYPHDGEYLKLDRPRLIEFTWISPGTQMQRTVVTVELRRVGEETDLTLTHKGIPAKDAADQHKGGWTQIVDHLADVLSKARR